MVDQNAAPQQPSNGKDETEEKHGSGVGLSSPTVAKAGEMMLIFALVLIFLVCAAVATHLYLRRQKRRRKKGAKETSKKVNRESQQTGPQTQESKMAELTGTPLCEMGESEPRYEMGVADANDRHQDARLQDPRDNPVHHRYSFDRYSFEPDLEAGIETFGEMSTRSPMEPSPATHAAYWSRAM